MTEVWVLIHNGGYDGYGEPLQGFSSEADARRALRLLRLPYEGGWEVFRLPMWPEVSGDRMPKPAMTFDTTVEEPAGAR